MVQRYFPKLCICTKTRTHVRNIYDSNELEWKQWYKKWKSGFEIYTILMNLKEALFPGKYIFLVVEHACFTNLCTMCVIIHVCNNNTEWQSLSVPKQNSIPVAWSPSWRDRLCWRSSVPRHNAYTFVSIREGHWVGYNTAMADLLDLCDVLVWLNYSSVTIHHTCAGQNICTSYVLKQYIADA